MPRICQLVLLGLSGAVASGCANLHIRAPLDPSMPASSGQAYLYGHFEEIKGGLNVSSMWIRLENVRTKATFEIQVKSGVRVFPVAPGTYRLTEFVYMAGGAPKSMLTKLDVKSVAIYPEPPPFSVQAGNAYYLGKFIAHSDHQISLLESKYVNTLDARMEGDASSTHEVLATYPGLRDLQFQYALYEEPVSGSEIDQ